MILRAKFSLGGRGVLSLISLVCSLTAGTVSGQSGGLLEQGRRMLDQGDFPAARRMFERIVDGHPADPAEEYEGSWNLGVLAWNDDGIEESHRYFARAGAIAAKEGWTKRSSDCASAEGIRESYVRGIEARSRGGAEMSREWFQKAAALAESIRSPGLLLKILRAWSTAYLGAPSRAEFRSLNERALAAARAFHHAGETYASLHNIAAHHFTKSEYSLALRRYFEALNEARSLADERNLLVCLSAIAGIYSALGSHVRAVEYYTEAVRISRRAGSALVTATTLGDWGDVHRRLFNVTGNPEEARRALERYREALAALSSGRSPELLLNDQRVRIGNILVDLGRADEAVDYLRAAADSHEAESRPDLRAAYACDLGRAFWAAGDAARAEAQFARALGIAAERAALPALPRAQFGLGLSAEKKGDFAAALSRYEEALDSARKLSAGIVEDIHRAEFGAGWGELYEKVIDLNTKLAGRAASGSSEREILRYIEMAKAGSYAGRISDERPAAGPAAGGPPPNLDREALSAKRNEALKALASRLEPAERSRYEFELRQIEDMLAAASGRMTAASGTGPEFATLESIRNGLLDDRTAMIEYWLGKDRSYALVLTRGDFGIIELPAANRIEASLSAYLGFLSDPEIAAAKGAPAGERLYRELFAPLAAAIPASTANLIIVPDGILNDLPFETLLIPQEGGRESRYLLELFAIRYAPSATALLEASKRPVHGLARGGLLAVGASDYARPPAEGERALASPSRLMAAIAEDKGLALLPLPGVAAEISRIARHFPKKKRRTIVGREATESAFKSALSEGLGIVHVASHALSDVIDPMRSALVFSPEDGGDEDGFLQLRELEGLRFSADLVVLSGCRTSQGKRFGHEGVVGLPRAMFALGARAVVSSLWQVQDRAAAAFMDAFYAALARSGDAAGALREAKIRMLKSKYAHPSSWAAFILTGLR